MKKGLHRTTIRHFVILLVTVLLPLFLRQVAVAQVTTISGTVSDAKTNKAVPFATTVFTGTSIGTSGNASGHSCFPAIQQETGSVYRTPDMPQRRSRSELARSKRSTLR